MFFSLISNSNHLLAGLWAERIDRRDKMCPKLGKRWLRVADERRTDTKKKTHTNTHAIRWIDDADFFFLHFLNLNIVIWIFVFTRNWRKTFEMIGSNGSQTLRRKKSIIYLFSFFPFHPLFICSLWPMFSLRRECVEYISRQPARRINVSFHIDIFTCTE